MFAKKAARNAGGELQRIDESGNLPQVDEPCADAGEAREASRAASESVVGPVSSRVVAGEIFTLLIPQIQVTSKLAGRSWDVPTGTFSWIGWKSRERPLPTYGEYDSAGVHDYTVGRLLFKPRAGVEEEDVAVTLDALTGLMGVAADFWGEQFSGVPVPPELLPAKELFAEDMEDAFEDAAPQFMGYAMQVRDSAFVGDGPPEWALERMNAAVSDLTGLVRALAYIFESRKEFHFLGDDITIVQRQPEDVPSSPIAAIRVETAFHNAYKSMEALLGGEPPRDSAKLRERLESRSIDPDEVAGFAGMREDMLTRVIRLQATRDKRSAHAGRTGIKSRPISYFELMDAQYAASTAIKWRVEAIRGAASGPAVD
jgi:hypothetical protein